MKPTYTLRSIVAISLFLLALAGCGGAGSGSSTTTGTGSTGTGGTGTGGTGTGGATTTSVTAAARLLDQATFGPTTADVAHVQSVGISGYLTEQYAATQTTLPILPNPLPVQCTNNPSSCFESEFWQTELTAHDQLRQRVAFSLGELFVASTQGVDANSMVPYYNTLSADAFTNWRTIMEDVTLSPAMGLYLNMLNSSKPATGQIANENFGREMLQLFSTGINKLNIDSSLQLDAGGNPIPVYTETQVEAFARAYTGWTYGNAAGAAVTKFPSSSYYFAPMAPLDTSHDMATKIVLDGTVIAAGGTAKSDLKAALDNIFNSSTLPPFICKQLIQHLVTSTPSAGYISRVANVFINNGSGVRGDMKSVLTAILTDTEARAGDTNASFDGGHLREPMLYLTSAMRGLSYTNTNTDATNLWAYAGLSGYSSSLGEQPMRSPSVFNFYPPGYVIPNTTINAPEFSLENTASVNLRLSLANTLSQGKFSLFATDLTKTSTLGVIAADPGNLADTLGIIFLHGQMPANMRATIVSAVTPLTDYGQRVRFAVYLVLSSSQYKVMH